ncbi:MAG TPA: hypothetical protein V6D33_00950 [Cyanophyceae cyanobacterium]
MIKKQVDVDVDTYDRGIVPAETAARKEREGDLFKHSPSQERQEHAATDDQTDAQSIETTGGYTVDKEGLLNNYAIEPEMYVNEPGDLRQHEEELQAERIQELEDINEDKQGDLTMEHDRRGKGQGII